MRGLRGPIFTPPPPNYWHDLNTSVQEHDRHLQLLMQQVEGEGQGEGPELVAKVKRLEKELYYYRKTSRDLRKQLQLLTTPTTTTTSHGAGQVGGATGKGVPRSRGVVEEEEGVNSAPELESGRSHRKTKKHKASGGGGGKSAPRGGVAVGGAKVEEIKQVCSVSAHREGGGDDSGRTRPLESKSASSIQVPRGACPLEGGVASGRDTQLVPVRKQRRELRQLRCVTCISMT